MHTHIKQFQKKQKMFSILIYALSSFYFILSNLPAAGNMAIGFAKSLPIVQTLPALTQIEKKFQTVVLPSASLRAAISGGLSLLAYPFIMTINEIVQFFIYWLALFGFSYLSLSQHPEVLQIFVNYVAQAVQVLKAAAPDQFQKMLSLTNTHTDSKSETLTE